MPPEELMKSARDFLRGRGFEPEPQQKDQANRLQLRRVKLKVGRTQSILDLPQRIRLDWDRGRVNVALSITPNVKSSGSFVLSGMSTVSSNSKKLRAHGELMTAIANSLELLLSQQLPPAKASVDWLKVETEIDHKAVRYKKMRAWKILLAVALLFIVPVVICILVLVLMPKH
jgi:hypothetical protein